MREPNADSHGNGNGYSFGDPDGYSNSNSYGYSNNYGYSNSHSDRYCHLYGEPDGNCIANAAVYPDAEAASHTSAAPDAITVTGTI